MTTVAEIIKDAYRESNAIPIGTDPTVAEQEEALRLLNRIRLSSIGYEAGELLDPFPIGANNIEAPTLFPFQPFVTNSQWFLPSNKRVMANLEQPFELRLDPYPDDGARFGYKDISGNFSINPLTIVGNGRKIAGATQIVANTDGEAKEFFYRDDLGEWFEILPTLALTDDWFFPIEYDDMFITMLAMRINPRHGLQMDEQSRRAFVRSLNQFKARYKQRTFTRSELALIRLADPANRNLVSFANPQDLFNRGYPAQVW